MVPAGVTFENLRSRPRHVYRRYEYLRVHFRAPFPVGGVHHVVVDVPARSGGHGATLPGETTGVRLDHDAWWPRESR